MAERNFDGIQFEKIRRVVDPDFNTVHDELSAAYYGKIPFRDYGVLDKATFAELVRAWNDKQSRIEPNWDI